MSRLNKSTRVLPGSPTTVTAPSMAPANPATGFKRLRRVQPSQIPAASAT